MLRKTADWCDANGVTNDIYGEGAFLNDFERNIASRLGKAAAVFMPSGVMAQLAAVRIWTRRTGLPRFGMHPTSHLILHEREAYQALLGLHGVVVGPRHAPLLAKDLQTVGEPLACLLVELPIREAGGQLPTWEELETLKTAARDRGLRLHMDGARLWESRAFYGRSYSEVAEGFASVYVSTYKGLGGVAGAFLAGDADFVEEAKIWRRRMGGTLVHLTPLAASSAMRLEERLQQMDACYARALSLAKALASVPGLTINPTTPHANMMHLHFDAPAVLVAQRRDAIAEAEGVWVVNDPRPSDIPGRCYSELYVGDTLAEMGDDAAAPFFARLLKGA